MPNRAKHAAAWTKVAFGDVVRQVKDRVDPEQSGLERYVAGEHMDTDDLRLRRWGDIGDGYLGPAFHMRFKPGHVLYGSRRTYLRKVAVADFEGITANTTYVLEPRDPNVLLPELLPFIMQTEAFNRHSVRESKGSVNPYVNFSDLAWYEFALPPVEDQRRMVCMLVAFWEATDRLEKAELALEVVLKSMLRDAFGPESKPLHQHPRLGALSLRIGDGTHLPPPFTDSGVPFLLVSNISGGFLDWNVEKHVSAESYAELTRSFRPGPGDVLYTLVGSYGVPVIVDTDRQFTFQRHIGYIRVNPDELLPEYLYWYLRSPAGVLQADCRAEGLAQKTITLKALRDFRVPMRDLPSQHKLVDRFSMVASQLIALHRRRASLVLQQRQLLNLVVAGGSA